MTNYVQISRGSPLVSNKQSTFRESNTEYFKFDRKSEKGDVMAHKAMMVSKIHSVSNNKNEIMGGNQIYERTCAITTRRDSVITTPDNSLEK